jgi:hypothetical protein
MKKLALGIAPVVLAALSVLAFPAHAKNCRKGIPCGNSCISASKTCRSSGGSTSSSYFAPSRVAPSVVAPPVSASPIKRPAKEIAVKDGVPLRAYPSEKAPITGHYIPGSSFDVYGSAGNWILISPLDAPKHQWMLQHGAK